MLNRVSKEFLNSTYGTDIVLSGIHGPHDGHEG